jgi:hypothetical protein
MPAGLPTTTILRTLRDARAAAAAPGVLLVAGPMAEQLARTLSAGGEPGSVRTTGAPEDVDALVVVLAGAPAPEEIELARRATRATVPVVAVQLDPAYEVEVPYVLATDVVPCPPGEGFPVDGIGRVLARRLRAESAPLAAALPRLRDSISKEAIRQTATRNALVPLLPIFPQVHFPVMVVNQLRLALGLSLAQGRDVSSAGPIDAASAFTGGLALRTLARAVVPRLPAGRRLARAGIAYAGTLALGEAVARRPSP